VQTSAPFPACLELQQSPVSALYRHFTPAWGAGWRVLGLRLLRKPRSWSKRTERWKDGVLPSYPVSLPSPPSEPAGERAPGQASW